MSVACQNCQTSLDGDYCAECGQSKTTLDIPVADFAKELASETFGLDSRLRLTLRPLFLIWRSSSRRLLARAGRCVA